MVDLYTGIQQCQVAKENSFVSSDHDGSSSEQGFHYFPISQKQSSSTHEIHPSSSRNCRSLWIQRLSKSRRRCKTPEISDGGPHREGLGGYNNSREMRLPGRVWLWSEHGRRWQIVQRHQNEGRYNESFGNRRIKKEKKSRTRFLVKKNRKFLSTPTFRHVYEWSLMLSILFVSLMCSKLSAFSFNYSPTLRTSHICKGKGQENCYTVRIMLSSVDSARKNLFRLNLAENYQDDFGSMNDDEEDLDAPSVVLEDLNWRVEKLRLEEANKRRFLKSRPRFLPYEECRKWVAAWSRWESEEEWRSWIEMGEKRNSYIPARPDEYYGRLGKWISWDHFLGLNEENGEDGSNDEDLNDS